MYAVLFEAVFEYFYLFIGHKAVRNLILLCPFAFAEFMVGEDFHDRVCHIHFFEQLGERLGICVDVIYQRDSDVKLIALMRKLYEFSTVILLLCSTYFLCISSSGCFMSTII